MRESTRIVYLMRGLPACGKSHMARRLASADGIVLETDQYFYTQVGDDPGAYDYSAERLPAARQWNFNRYREAIARGISPIVVDRGNGLNPETREYAVYAAEHHYRIELCEPNSSWWQELRVLLKYKQHVADDLFDAWAKRLADATRDTHRVPSATIRHWMSCWRRDLTVEEILNYKDRSD
ncbi:MAG: AAA family ATPase [Pirellulaceae bacterium]